MLANVLKFFVQLVWLFCVDSQAGCRESGPVIVQENQRVFVVGWLSNSSLLWVQRCTLVDVACFHSCASTDWAIVDISAMKHLRPWIAMLHNRPSFSTGLTIPFPWLAFFGPPDATQVDIEAEIARNAGQFAVMTKLPS